MFDFPDFRTFCVSGRGEGRVRKSDTQEGPADDIRSSAVCDHNSTSCDLAVRQKPQSRTPGRRACQAQKDGFMSAKVMPGKIFHYL